MGFSLRLRSSPRRYGKGKAGEASEDYGNFLLYTFVTAIYRGLQKKTSSTFLVEEALEKESSEISGVKVCGVLNVSASRALRLTPATEQATHHQELSRGHRWSCSPAFHARFYISRHTNALRYYAPELVILQGGGLCSTSIR